MLSQAAEKPPLATVQRPDIVPYITRWSGEKARPGRVVVRRGGRGIGYVDERTYDRDARGVLWSRVPSSPGRGRPEFGSVHALRQMLAMQGLLCQVCGEAADRTGDGVLWLLGVDPEQGTDWPDELTTTHPPVCWPCAVAAVRACPHLRRGYTAIRARDVTLAGVRGALYRPKDSGTGTGTGAHTGAGARTGTNTGAGARTGTVALDAANVAFDDPMIHWVRAGQLIMALREFQRVELAADGGR